MTAFTESVFRQLMEEATMAWRERADCLLARSMTVAYGNNRADFSFIPGGVVPGAHLGSELVHEPGHEAGDIHGGPSGAGGRRPGAAGEWRCGTPMGWWSPSTTTSSRSG